MEDGVNFLSQMTGYASLAANTRTICDDTDPAPDGTDAFVRHLLFLRSGSGAQVSGFHGWVDDELILVLATIPQLRKLRRHLFEELDVTLDHPRAVADLTRKIAQRNCGAATKATDPG
jgi:hypothetical protein